MDAATLFESQLRESLERHNTPSIMDKIAAFHAEQGDLVEDVVEELPLEDRLAKVAEAISARLNSEPEEPEEPGEVEETPEQSLLERLRG